jgi:hypothetical protein
MGKDRLIVINRERSKLPHELPPNLIYWIKCETRVRPPVESAESLITEDELQLYYRTRVTVIDSNFH